MPQCHDLGSASEDVVHGTPASAGKCSQSSVCVFNEGANELISVMNRMFIDISHITLQLLSQKDDRRISQADAAASADARD